MSDFETINIKDIKPAIYNPRKISNKDFNKLSNSISEFGVINPIIVNLKNNHIIGGHQRYSVLLDEFEASGEYKELYLLRLGDIGWVFPSTDLSVDDLNTEKAMNLALNKISGEWDLPKLENLLIDLDVEEYDIDVTGFDNMDIKEFNIDLKRNIKLESPQEKLEKELKKEESDKEKNYQEYIENESELQRTSDYDVNPYEEYINDEEQVKSKEIVDDEEHKPLNNTVYTITIYCDSMEEQDSLYHDLELMGVKCIKDK